MKYKKISSVFLLWGFVVVFLITSTSANAAVYGVSLEFETVNQNMWGGGSSFTMDWGWAPERVAINPLNLKPILFDGVLGEKVYVPPVILPNLFGPDIVLVEGGYVDYRLGAEYKGFLHGNMGLEFGASIDTGSVNASYPADVKLTMPDPGTVKPGETYKILSEYQEPPGAKFDTTFPEVQFWVDLVVDARTGIEQTLYALGNVSTSRILEIDIPEFKLEIFGFNRNSDGDVSILGIDTLIAGGDTPVPGLNSYIAGSMNIPVIKTDSQPSTTDPTLYQSSGQTDFLEVELDVDNIATRIFYAAMGIPFGFDTLPELPINDKGDKMKLPASVFDGGIPGLFDFTLLDIDAGIEIDILQNFWWQPDLWITLLDGDGNQVAKFLAGDDSGELIMGESASELTAVFTLENAFSNTTSLKIIPEIEIGIFGVGIGPVWLGYLELIELQLNTLPKIPIYGEGALIGDPFSLAFETFIREYSIEPFSTTGNSAVPEPSSMILLGLGLIGTAGFARRKGTQ